MRHEDDTPLSDEELALAKKGEALISAAVADTHAPQSLRESIERDRERAQAAPRTPFWRRHLRALTATATAAAALAGSSSRLSRAARPRSRRWPRSRQPRGSKRPGRLRRRAAATRPSSPPGSGRSPSPTGRRNSAGRPSAVARTRSRAAPSRPSSTATPTAPGSATRSSPASPSRERPPGHEVTRSGNTYHVAQAGEHTLVTWTQQGHTCTFVASSTVPEARLVDLAASRNT